MINIFSSYFIKEAKVVASFFAKSTALANPIKFGKNLPKFPKGNPSVSLNNTMAKFHANHDLEQLNKKGIKPPDQFAKNQIDINNKEMSHLPERRLLLANMRGR